MFKNIPATPKISNNKNEFTRKRQQGGVIVEAKRDFSRYATSTGADPTGLGK